MGAGEVELPGRIALESGGLSVLEALTQALAEFPEYRLVTDQEQYPWKLSVLPTPNVPQQEGRLERNLAAAVVLRDASWICTRAVSENLPGGFLDGEAAERWGVVCRALAIPDDAEPEAALAAARRFLCNRAEPALSIALEACDLSRATGEPQDALKTGARYRLVLPGDESPAPQQISEIYYEDALHAPERARITLCNRQESVLRSLVRLRERLSRAERSARRTRSRSRRNQKRLEQQEGVLTDAEPASLGVLGMTWLAWQRYRSFSRTWEPCRRRRSGNSKTHPALSLWTATK